MPKSIYDRGLFRPVDVDKLQRVFDEACRRRSIVPETPDARELALTIINLHEAGMSDEAMLLAAVGFAPPRQQSA